MNLLNIIEKLNLDKIDQEEFLKPALRRGLFKKASEYSLKAALTSLPFAMMAMPSIVKASTKDAVTEALDLALTLEYLEAEFYKLGVTGFNGGPSIIPTADKAIFEQILLHENQHVAFLKTVLKYSDDSKKPMFDFTVGGAFDAFGDYPTFLALAQAFEDTGVRAYKGQAGNVMSDKVVLTAALQIHSVEARHAAEVRRLRGQKGWITKADRGGLPTQTQPVYDGEEILMQGGLNIAGLAGLSDDHLTQAFDEPMSGATATAIAGLFIKK